MSLGAVLPTIDPGHIDIASIGITIARIKVHSIRLSEAVDRSAIHDRFETARIGSGQVELLARAAFGLELCSGHRRLRIDLPRVRAAVAPVTAHGHSSGNGHYASPLT
jgi:hypothetical protein